MIKVGIVGCGTTIGIAKRHVKGFLQIQEAKITAMYDILSERAEAYVEEFGLRGSCKVCGTLEELYPLVDAVVICTPNATHSDLAVSALKAGKHVLCEKPFGCNAEECMEAVKYEKLTDKVTAIGLCYRFIPAFAYMKQLIKEDLIGDIFFVREEQGGGRIGNPDVKLEWRLQKELSGSGATSDFGSHMLDICDWLLREKCGPIREVTCKQHICIPEREIIGQPGKMGKVTNDDVGMWIARTENGVMESFIASRVGAVFRLEIIGSGGTLLFDADNGESIVYHEKDKMGGYKGTPKVLPCPSEYFVEGESRHFLEMSFYLEAKNFIDSIINHIKPVVNFERGLYIQKLLDACQKSADIGETVRIDFE